MMKSYEEALDVVMGLIALPEKALCELKEEVSDSKKYQYLLNAIEDVKLDLVINFAL